MIIYIYPQSNEFYDSHHSLAHGGPALNASIHRYQKLRVAHDINIMEAINNCIRIYITVHLKCFSHGISAVYIESSRHCTLQMMYHLKEYEYVYYKQFSANDGEGDCLMQHTTLTNANNITDTQL